jgi:hypothetical protein
MPKCPTRNPALRNRLAVELSPKRHLPRGARSRSLRFPEDPGAGFAPVPAGTAPLSTLGISKNQSSEWQKLAEATEEVFEREVAQPGASAASIVLGLGVPARLRARECVHLAA